jgi:carbonic anhydrase/acetyltransferase-like protein (isoleucine patch superfamily)
LNMIRAFNGKTPVIAESAFVSEAAYVVGAVEIGENASVWPGAVIRGDFGKITIGSHTAVEDNCVIHSGTPSSPVGDVFIGSKVHIGHGAVLNCARIGDNVLIGMNATLLHDVVIGNRCVIGANCLVRQAMKIPDNSFVVGVPGKVKGPLSADQEWWIEEARNEYARLARLYKAEGL